MGGMRRNPSPRERHREREHGIGGGEHPFWKIVVQQARYPAADEACILRAATPQRIFPDGERAGHADQRLANDQQDRAQMQRPKCSSPHPGPAKRRAGKNQRQPADHKQDEQKVKQEDRVGEHGSG